MPVSSHQNIPSNEDRLQRLHDLVPGFRGYSERHARRTSDALQRQTLATRLADLKASLEELALTLANNQRIDILAEIDRIRKRIEEQIGEIRFASDRYQAFFRAQTIDRETLDAVYAFDIGLHRRLDSLKRAVQTLTMEMAELPKVRCRCRKVAMRFERLENELHHRAEALQNIS